MKPVPTTAARMFLNERRGQSLCGIRHSAYQRAGSALFSSMNTAISATDRRQAWECARDDAHLAFRLWCSAPYGTKSEAYTAYRAAADREDVAIAALMTA
jgi:hypothetical protein